MQAPVGAVGLAAADDAVAGRFFGGDPVESALFAVFVVQQDAAQVGAYRVGGVVSHDVDLAGR